jgi:hypothetical protein
MHSDNAYLFLFCWELLSTSMTVLELTKSTGIVNYEPLETISGMQDLAVHCRVVVSTEPDSTMSRAMWLC